MTITCFQLCYYFRQIANHQHSDRDAQVLLAYIDMLKHFGNQEVPESFWNVWDRPKIEKFLSQ